MTRRIDRQKNTPQWAAPISNASRPSTPSRIQPVEPRSPPYPFGHPQNVFGGNPVAPFRGGVSHDKTAVYSFRVKYESMQDKTPANFIQYHRAIVERRCGCRTNSNRFSLANGRIHAGSARAEGHGGLLSQKSLDELLAFGHDETIPYLKGVGKT